MHWPSFFIGALVGWIAEWFIDLSYWRRKYTGMVEAEAETRTQLVNAQGELETLGAQLTGYQEIETQLAACRNELQTRIQAVERLNGALVTAKADVDALRTELTETKAAHQAQVHKLQAALSAARDEIGTLRTKQARRPEPGTVRGQ